MCGRPARGDYANRPNSVVYVGEYRLRNVRGKLGISSCRELRVQR
jgi:hypothetical protein